mmetsp:Transcript_21071/g.62349  ORF Transcript_21071/g.62349 Transcript_21071/m.62349 type:complete len:579 (-) Transcript_21071:639-2375(-)
MTRRAHSESPPSSSDESAPSANPASLAAATLWSLPSTSARKAKRLLSRISAGVASRSRSGESNGSTPCSRAESCASGIPSESASIAPSAASSPSACGPPRRMQINFGIAPISTRERRVSASARITAPSRSVAARDRTVQSSEPSCSTKRGSPPPVATAAETERARDSSPNAERVPRVAAASDATRFDRSLTRVTSTEGTPSLTTSARQNASRPAASEIVSMAAAVSFAGASSCEMMPATVWRPPACPKLVAESLDPRNSVQTASAPASAPARAGRFVENPPSSKGRSASIAPASRARCCASGRRAAMRAIAAALETAASAAGPRARHWTIAGSACALRSTSAQPGSHDIAAIAAAAGEANVNGEAGAKWRRRRGMTPAATRAVRAGGWPLRERMTSRVACCRSLLPAPGETLPTCVMRRRGPSAWTNCSSSRGWCDWLAQSALRTSVRSSTPRSENGAPRRAAMRDRPFSAASSSCIASSRAQSVPTASAALTATSSWGDSRRAARAVKSFEETASSTRETSESVLSLARPEATAVARACPDRSVSSTKDVSATSGSLCRCAAFRAPSSAPSSRARAI